MNLLASAGADSGGAFFDMVEQIALYYLIAVLMTLVASVLVCRYRAACKKGWFLASSLATAVVANLLLLMGSALWSQACAHGWRVFEDWDWI
jgi:hypothetical protein